MRLGESNPRLITNSMEANLNIADVWNRSTEGAGTSACRHTGSAPTLYGNDPKTQGKRVRQNVLTEKSTYKVESLNTPPPKKRKEKRKNKKALSNLCALGESNPGLITNSMETNLDIPDVWNHSTEGAGTSACRHTVRCLMWQATKKNANEENSCTLRESNLELIRNVPGY
ncbi:hypothetical protein K438DRAFT_1766927 [Mycena galopus ATCC 62051]|nr:hypothetical protein K438DRAFT_1766927 [Mycena galopus ATCC 62051]